MDDRRRHIYLTGASGFIGGRLARHLLSTGARLTALVRRPDSVADLAALGAEIEQGDLLDPGSLRPRGDCVVHCAATAAFGVPRRRHQTMFRVNVDGTRALLDASARAGIRRFVHVSSSLVYRHAGTSGQPADERAPLEAFHAGSPVAESKLQAHRLVVDADGRHGMRTVVAVPTAVVGVGAQLEALYGRWMQGRGGGLAPSHPQEKGWVHVADVVEALSALTSLGDGVYILSDVHLSIADFLREVARLANVEAPRPKIGNGILGPLARATTTVLNVFGKDSALSPEMISYFNYRQVLSSERARQDLGWTPRLWERLATELPTQRQQGSRPAS